MSIFAGVAAVVVIALGAWGFFVWWTVQKSIAVSVGLIAQAAPYEQHPSHASSRILVAGDSTAVGVGSASSTSVAGRVGADFPQADVTNLGISGLRLAELKKILRAQAGKKYDLVLLQIGANDITGRTPYGSIRADLAAVLDMADTLAPRIAVMTAGNVGTSPAFRWPLSWYITARTRVVREIFIDEVLKRPHAAYADLFKEAADEPFSKDIPRFYARDFFHPSAEGYGLWYAALRPLLGL